MKFAAVNAFDFRVCECAAVNSVNDFCFDRQFTNEFVDLRSAIGRARQVDDKGLDVHVKPERAKVNSAEAAFYICYALNFRKSHLLAYFMKISRSDLFFDPLALGCPVVPLPAFPAEATDFDVPIG